MPIFCTCELCTRGQQGTRLERLLWELEECRIDYGAHASYGTMRQVERATLPGAPAGEISLAIEMLRSDYRNDYQRDDYDSDYDSDYDDSDYDSDYGSDLIHYHDYRPRPVFFGDGPLFMGFELETAVSGYGGLESAARTVLDRVGDHAYLKEDGSISHGFEIVTHPMSYDYAINSFPWELMSDMRAAGIGPDHSTGLHVHVSRAAFTSPAHIYRWMKFIYRNQTQVEGIARRSSTGWAKFETGHRKEILSFAKHPPGMGGYYGDRYSAINVQNDATFEVRIFNSTNKRRELQAALGLVDASVRYAADIDSAAILNAKAWEFPAFVDWAHTAEKRGKSKAPYSSLLTEVERLELV